MAVSEFMPPIWGGLLIGVAAILMLLGTGRVMGVSGILGRFIAESEGRHWRGYFLGGTLLGAFLLHSLTEVEIPSPSEAGPVMAVIAGLLVGFGTRMGSGCTSGHGVCGIGRLSPRSLVATVTFILFGVITVTIIRFGFGV